MQMENNSNKPKPVVYPDQDIADLVPSFLQNRQTDIVAIETAIKQSDFAALRRIGHTLKGISRPYGFNKLEDYGRELEQAALDQNLERLQLVFDQIRTYVETVEVIYPT